MLRVTFELITGPKGTGKTLVQYEISNVTQPAMVRERVYEVTRRDRDGRCDGVTVLVVAEHATLDELVERAVGRVASRFGAKHHVGVLP